MVRETGVEGTRTRIEAARLLAWLPDAFEPQLRRLLADENPDVARQAVLAVGALRKRLLVPEVLDLLRDPLVVPDAIEALALFGDSIVGTLRDYLADSGIPREIRRELPELLLRIGSPAAQYTLVENLMERDTRIRLRVITALNKMLQADPTRRIDRAVVSRVLHAEIVGLYRSQQVLGALQRHNAAPDPVVHALRDAMAQEAERVFRLLKVLYPQADMHSAYVGLQSENPVVHDNALEFVETVLSPDLRERLLPLLDSGVTVDDRVQLADTWTHAPIRSAAEAVRVLIHVDDAWLQSCAAVLIGELRLEAFAEPLRRWAEDPNTLLRGAAREALAKLPTSSAQLPR
jgi:AAA family ATP:ADP antiporter